MVQISSMIGLPDKICGGNQEFSKAMQAERKMWSMPHHARIRLF
jgi:hypothetical protein